MPSPPICVAVRSAIRGSGLTQEAVASQLNEKQQTISGWMLAREPRLDDLRRIEEVLHKPKGFLLRTAGYVDDLVDCRECLRGDTRLNEPHRALLLAAYDSAVELAKREDRTRKTPAEKPIKRSRS